MMHRAPRVQLSYINIALTGRAEFYVWKGNVLSCFNKMINEKLEKKQTNWRFNLVPVGLDLLVVKGRAMVAMEIFWFAVKNELSLSKNEQVSAQKLYQYW